MSPLKIIGTKNLQKLKPEDRMCYFKTGDEEAMKTVSLHSSYTQSSCMLECQIKWGKEQVRDNTMTVLRIFLSILFITDDGEWQVVRALVLAKHE
jgi:hypothetical protein